MEDIRLPGATLKVVYGRTTKRVTLQRSLVALISHYPEEVSFKHLLVLYDNMLWLQEKCEEDPVFREKFGITLKVLAYVLKGLNLTHHTFPARTLQKLSETFRRNLKHFSLEKRNTKQPLKQQMSHVEVRPTTQQGVLNKLLPPQRYIGIGYRDKGTAKKPWLDGSPSWQEVASVPLEKLYG